MVRITNWLDKEYDITVSSGEPSKYIELLLTDLNYRRKWVLKENKYIILDKEPIDKIIKYTGLSKEEINMI